VHVLVLTIEYIQMNLVSLSGCNTVLLWLWFDRGCQETDIRMD